ncbi:MAG: FecR domain-containing protein, partial [Pseudomonadota bacterium]
MDWVVRVEAKDVSTEDLDAFGDWLAADVRHRKEYAKADRLWQNLGRAITREDMEAYRAQNPGHSSRARLIKWRDGRLRWSAFAACAMTLLAGAILWNQVPGTVSPATSPYTYTNNLKQAEQLSLDDGTEVILGANSELTVAFSAGARSIALVSGEAFFNVATELDRPFVVDAGTLSLRVTGTVFDVQRKGSITQVAVAEGSVHLTHPTVLAPAPPGSSRAAGAVTANQVLPLVAGERVIAVENRGFGPVYPIQPERIGAWRQGHLVYSNVPLKAIVEDLNRYDNRSFSIDDATIADIEISATFDSRDINSVLRSLTELLPVKIQQDPAGNV